MFKHGEAEKDITIEIIDDEVRVKGQGSGSRVRVKGQALGVGSGVMVRVKISQLKSLTTRLGLRVRVKG